MDQVERITARVWRLGTPFGVDGLVFTYFVCGDTVAIIDPGPSTATPRTLAPALNVLGASPPDVSAVVGTHGHYDHYSAAQALQTWLPNASFYLHANDVEMATSHTAQIGLLTRHLRLLGHEGVAEHDAEAISREFRHIDPDLVVPLTGGEVIDLGSAQLHAVAVSGHTTGSLSYVLADEGSAFTGDALQGFGSRCGGGPLYFHPHEYRDSLRQLLRNPPDRLYLGHGFHSTLPVNWPTKDGQDVPRFIADSLTAYEATEAAVDSVLMEQPAADLKSQVGAVVRALITTLPVRLDEHTGLPKLAPATIVAHLVERGAVL